MNRTLHNTENTQGRSNKLPTYSQTTRPPPTRSPSIPQQQQTTDGQSLEQQTLLKTKNTYNQPYHGYQNYKHSSYNNNNNNNNNSNRYGGHKQRDTNYNNNNYQKKPPVQLPMASPTTTTDTAPIQFGSINQPVHATTTDVGTRSTEIQYGTTSPQDTANHYNKQRSHYNRPPPPSSQQPSSYHTNSNNSSNNTNPKSEIPRSPRATNDGRLFTQPYAPRRDLNQGDYNHSNNNRYYTNQNNTNNNNVYRGNPNYGRSPQQTHQPQPQPSPQQHSPQTLPPSPMSVHHVSPNMNNNYQKKNTISPQVQHASPQNIQMTANWTTGQYYYPQYQVSVSPYNVIPTNRSPIVHPPAPRKPIAIINPLTGNALNTSPMSLSSSISPVQSNMHIKPEEKLDFKVPAPHISKAVVIVDPAIRARELREKKEREEAEQEAFKKAEEEKLEAERLEKEQIEKKEAERVEAERVETERRLKAEADAIAKAEAEVEAKRLQEEEEAKRKAEADKEAKRVATELEAKKRRDEQDRIMAAEVASQKVGRVPTALDISTSQPKSAVTKSTQIIRDASTIQYPTGIHAPSTKEENEGKLVYSIDFLLQFQQICLDTDVDLSVIMNEMGLSGGNNPSTYQYSDRGKGPRTPGHSNMTGDSMFRTGSRDGPMQMGKFNMGRPLTAGRTGSFVERQGSARGGGNISNRGGRGGSGMKVTRNPPQGQGAPTIPFDQVVPLEKSENRWVPAAATAAPISEDELMSQEFITRKVNALLNKLTMEKFESISTQIFNYAKQSSKEEDGRSLRTVIKLTFEKACDEPAFASMWARLCLAMRDAMTDDIRDTSILNEAKEPSSGVLLFRKYLFNRCQLEFEKGWKTNMPKVEETDGMLSDEYYIAAKAKRQGLGLIQFIGELFKLDMLSDRIMYNCLLRLCNDAATAGDEEAESLCKLLSTIGKVFDSKAKTSRYLDVFLGRMKNEMINSPNLTSRVKFMIQDLLDLRRDKWVPRGNSTQIGPTTIAKIHEMAEKAKEEKEAAAMKRNTGSRGQQQHYIPNNQYNNHNHNMSRNGSYRNERDQHYHNNNNHNHSNNQNNHTDGWSTVGSMPSPGIGGGSNKSKMNNELTNFGKTDRSRVKSNVLGPGNSPFASLTRGKSGINTDIKNPSDGRSSPATNMFSALERSDERKKLQLSPKTFEDASEVKTSKPKLSDDAVKRKSKNIIEEYFSIHDKEELKECILELDDPHYLVLFIGEMLTAVEKKAEDVENTAGVIEYLSTENLLAKSLYVKAFKSFMEGYDDLTIDVPQAPKYVATLLHASSVTPEEVDDEGFPSLKNAYQNLQADTA